MKTFIIQTPTYMDIIKQNTGINENNFQEQGTIEEIKDQTKELTHSTLCLLENDLDKVKENFINTLQLKIQIPELRSKVYKIVNDFFRQNNIFDYSESVDGNTNIQFHDNESVESLLFQLNSIKIHENNFIEIKKGIEIIQGELIHAENRLQLSKDRNNLDKKQIEKFEEKRDKISLKLESAIKELDNLNLDNASDVHEDSIINDYKYYCSLVPKIITYVECLNDTNNEDTNKGHLKFSVNKKLSYAFSASIMLGIGYFAIDMNLTKLKFINLENEILEEMLKLEEKKELRIEKMIQVKKLLEAKLIEEKNRKKQLIIDQANIHPKVIPGLEDYRVNFSLKNTTLVGSVNDIYEVLLEVNLSNKNGNKTKNYTFYMHKKYLFAGNNDKIDLTYNSFDCGSINGYKGNTITYSNEVDLTPFSYEFDMGPTSTTSGTPQYKSIVHTDYCKNVLKNK